MKRKKRLYKIPVGIKAKKGEFGITKEFINVMAVNRKAAEQQVRKKHLQKGYSILH